LLRTAPMFNVLARTEQEQVGQASTFTNPQLLPVCPRVPSANPNHVVPNGAREVSNLPAKSSSAPSRLYARSSSPFLATSPTSSPSAAPHTQSALPAPPLAPAPDAQKASSPASWPRPSASISAAAARQAWQLSSASPSAASSFLPSKRPPKSRGAAPLRPMSARSFDLARFKGLKL